MGLPGCVSQGKTREEAMASIRDAIPGYLDSLKKHGEPIPRGITEEIVESHSLQSPTHWGRIGGGT
jgi:antitoxin HicB